MARLSRMQPSCCSAARSARSVSPHGTPLPSATVQDCAMPCYAMPCFGLVGSGVLASQCPARHDTLSPLVPLRPLSPSMPSQRGHKERNLLGGRDAACLAVRRMWLCAVDRTCRVVGQTGTAHRVLNNHRITADHFGEKTSHGGKIKVACVIVEQLPR